MKLSIFFYLFKVDSENLYYPMLHGNGSGYVEAEV